MCKKGAVELMVGLHHNFHVITLYDQYYEYFEIMLSMHDSSIIRESLEVS